MSLSLYFDTYASTAKLEDGESAPELVVLHGWGMHSLVWDEVIPGLLEKFQVTVIDLPGFGRSPMPGGDYDLEYLITHVLAVAPKKAVWLGWSLGGLVALAIAAKHPERVDGVIGVSCNPRFTRNEQWPSSNSPSRMRWNSSKFSSTLRSRNGLFLPGSVRVPRYSRASAALRSHT